VDAMHGRFYTNLEDKDRSLAIDLKTRKNDCHLESTMWPRGPHGWARIRKAGLLFVACSTLVGCLT